MKWVTREKARVDRIACPWLITRFVDKEPTFLFVPARDVLAVAKKEDAIPYDVPDVELGHHGDQCSFDAFVDKYKLTDPALRELALIVVANHIGQGVEASGARAEASPPRFPE